MFCHKCGTRLPENSQFCRNCGQSQIAPVATSPSGAAVAVAPASVANEPKQRIFTPWLWWTILAIGVIIGITLIVNQANEQAKLRAPRQYTATLPQTSFTVAPQSFNSYKFTVPEGAYNVHFDGDYSASGGQNDIVVLLLTQDDFVNWLNRLATNALYSTGRETKGTIKIALPSGVGTYQFIFNNRFSTFTSKDIAAHATLSYTKVPDPNEIGRP